MSDEPTGPPVHTPEVVEFLREAELDIEGRMPWSSNGTWLVNLLGTDDGTGTPRRAIYKPHAHERPLWDFPDGLYLREVASYELSQHLGWNLVPPTVLRGGPHGVGSVQLFIEADFEQHYFTLMEADRNLEDFRALCAFDLVSNNTDRKSGHCLIGTDGHLWAIDHGLCFHTEYKLRTVIWEFSCESLEAPLRDDLETLLTNLNDSRSRLLRALRPLVSRQEQQAIARRIAFLLKKGAYPEPLTHRRNYPWPPI